MAGTASVAWLSSSNPVASGPQFINANSASESGATGTVVLTDPGTAGAFLLVLLSTDGDDVWSAPDGTWTQLFNDFITVDSARVNVWWKQSAVGSGTYTFSVTSERALGGIIAAYSGTAASSTINASDKNPDNVGSTDPWTIVAPTITTTANNCLLLWFAVVDPQGTTGTDSFTAPSGYSLRKQLTDTTGWVGMAIADKAQTTAGATGTASGTDTRAGSLTAGNIGYHIAIKPP